MIHKICLNFINQILVFLFEGMCQKEMETCLEHLKKYDGAVLDLVGGNEQLHHQIDKQAKEVESLKGRVLELETRNVLLEAEVG